MPALSPTMSTGTIVSWEKQEGEEVMDGDVLAQVETDKATMDMDSPQSGFLAKIVIPEGTKDIPLGKVACSFYMTFMTIIVQISACLCHCGE